MDCHKRAAVIAACMATFSSCAHSADTVAEQLRDLPAIYVSACYQWLKVNNRVGSLTPERLTAALKQRLETEGLVNFDRNPDPRSIERALAWGRDVIAVEDPKCWRAPIDVADVMRAVSEAQREQQAGDAALKKEARDKYWREHAKDPVTVDYAQYSQSVSGRSAKPRNPAGTVKTLTVSQYLAWEKQMQEKWARSVIGAGSSPNVIQVHDQCKNDVATQWRNSFGYDDAVLRAEAFGKDAITLSFAISATCATDLVRAAGIPVTTEVPRVGSVVRF